MQPNNSSEFSAEELQTIIGFVNSEAGKKYFNEIRAAMPKAIHAPLSGAEGKLTYLDIMKGYELCLHQAKEVIGLNPKKAKSNEQREPDPVEQFTKRKHGEFESS